MKFHELFCKLTQLLQYSFIKSYHFLGSLCLDVDECFPSQLSDDYLHLAHNCHADTVPTQKDHSTALVIQDTLEMELHALVK